MGFADARHPNDVRPEAAGLENIPGKGAVATVDGHRVAVGSRVLMEDEQEGPRACAEKRPARFTGR